TRTPRDRGAIEHAHLEARRHRSPWRRGNITRRGVAGLRRIARLGRVLPGWWISTGRRWLPWLCRRGEPRDRRDRKRERRSRRWRLRDRVEREDRNQQGQRE